MLACWGAFLGLIPPVFLTDEVEGLNPKDFLYAGSLAIVGLVVADHHGADRDGDGDQGLVRPGLDTYRLNLSRNRPPYPRRRSVSPTTTSSAGRAGRRWNSKPRRSLAASPNLRASPSDSAQACVS